MKLQALILSLAAAALIGCGSAPTKEINPEHAEMQARLEITQLVEDYAVYRDAKDPEGYASIFTEDGEFYYRGDVYKGHDALAERMEAINPASNTMHVISTRQITFIDDTSATGVSYATIYSKTTDEPVDPGEAVNLSNFAVMVKYVDKYQLTESGWKISERRITPVFLPVE